MTGTGVDLDTQAPDATASDDRPRSSSRGPYRKTAARRREILDAALAVFGRSGYRSGSLREIAEAVGISQPGLLHHFVNKNALLTEVLRRRDEISLTFYKRPTGIDTLVSTVRVVEFNVAHPGTVELHCVLSAEATASDHPAHEYFIERYNYLTSEMRSAFENMRESGELRPGIDPDTAARSTLALLDGLQVQWLLNPGEIDMPADADAYFRQLCIDGAWDAALAAHPAELGAAAWAGGPIPERSVPPDFD